MWLRRNKILHEKKVQSVEDTIFFICKYLREWEEVNHRLPGQRVVEERWRPPKPDEIKINFDGAFDKQTFKFGIGIVCRDPEGKILNCRSKVNNRIPTTFAVEALACLQAVRMGLDLGYRRVVVEGDALSIIKKLQRKENDKSVLTLYTINIKTFSNKFNKCKFRQIGRKGNETAHAVAKEALKLNGSTYIEGRLPKMVLAVATKDARDLELS
uniref:RNase H type-1 domain-containing protein n=1 Tax=Gossypium raimondii TaxID=29730 RepID=A0A0D2TX68_GOSRA|nr:hypothetical protein B456_009G352100 [Gossypium raimondii]